MSELLTTAEVAARVKKHPKTVERAIRDGRLRATRLSGTEHGRYGIAPEWVDEWIAAGQVRMRALPPSIAEPGRPTRRGGDGTVTVMPGMGRKAA